MSKVNQRTTFWHSAPSKRISRGTDPQDTRASTRTGLPPIELHPSISFEETFVRGKNFGKPVKSNIAVQAIPRDIRHAAVEIDTARGGGGGGAGRQNYLKAMIADLQNDVRMKEEELEHVTELCDSTKEKLIQSERRVSELEYVELRVVELENDVMTKEKIIMDQTQNIHQLKTHHADTVSRMLKEADQRVEEAKESQRSHVEFKQTKINDVKHEISNMINQSSLERGEQLRDMQQSLLESKKERRRLQKLVDHYKADQRVEEAKESQRSHVEFKQTKINDVKHEISNMINQSSLERGEQLRDMQQSLLESKKERRRLQKLVDHYKDSCPSCEEHRKTIKGRDEEIEALKLSETNLKNEVQQLQSKLNFQTELKVSEMEKIRSLHESEMRSRETTIKQLKTEVTNTWDAKAAERVGEMRKMERLVNTLQKENSALNLEISQVKHRLEVSQNKIEKLEAKLIHVKEQKVKLADLLVSSQEDAQNMQLEYEAQLDELYQRLEEQLEEEEDDQEEVTPSRNGAPQDSMLQSYRPEEDEEHGSQVNEASDWSSYSANEKRKSKVKRRQSSLQSSSTLSNRRRATGSTLREEPM